VTSLNYCYCYWLRNFSALEQSVVPNISIHNVHLNGLQCGFASVFMWSDFEKLLSHFEQLKVFSSVWVLSCSFKELDLEKHFSGFAHLNGISPVWVLSCSIKLPAIEKLLTTHSVQLKGFSSVWILSCSFKELNLEKYLSHLVHLNGISPEWVPICSFKWQASHFVHLNGFSTVSTSNLIVRSSCHTLCT